MAITLEQAQAKLQKYLDAEDATLTSQRYKTLNKEMQKAELASIREGIKYWNNMVDKLTASRTAPRVMRVVPRD